MTSILLFFFHFQPLSPYILPLSFPSSYLSNLKINPNNKPKKRFSRKKIFPLTQYPLIPFSLLMRVINFRWSFEFNLLNNFCLLLFQWFKLQMKSLLKFSYEFGRRKRFVSARIVSHDVCCRHSSLNLFSFSTKPNTHVHIRYFVVQDSFPLQTHIRPNKTKPKWITIKMKNS